MSILDDIVGGVGGAGLGFLTGGPVGAIAGGLGGFASAAGAANQRDWSADQAQKQMDFQERMSSTAWQRATADMKAAGINPMLAFMQGGASSPSGAIGTGGEAPLSAAVSSALNVQQVKRQLDIMEQQKDLLYSQAQKSQQDRQIDALKLSFTDDDSTPMELRRMIKENALLDARYSSAMAAARLDQAQIGGAAWMSKHPMFGRLLPGMGSSAISAAAAAAR